MSTDYILLGKDAPAGPEPQRHHRLRRVAALLLLLFSYPLSLLLSTLLQVAEALLARALWNDGRPGELMEACLTRFYPLVSQSEAQRFLFVALCLLAVLLFFGDGLPRRGGKQEDKG